MSNDYYSVIYGNYGSSNYPERLTRYIVTRFMGYGNYNYFFKENKKTLLDVGCSDGRYVLEFKKKNLESFGIDRDRKIWFDGSNNLMENNSELDLEDSFGIENEFDYIFSKSTIEHIKNVEGFLRNIYNLLKKKGKIIILTPAWEYNYRWFYDDPTHVKPFHRKGLQDALRMADFKNVKVEYFYHLPLFWKYNFLKPLASLIRTLPDDLRWNDWEQQDMNIFTRFCKEVQLLAVGEK